MNRKKKTENTKKFRDVKKDRNKNEKKKKKTKKKKKKKKYEVFRNKEIQSQFKTYTKFCLQKQTNETKHIVSRNKETQSLKKQRNMKSQEAKNMYGGTKNMKQNMAVNTSQ